MGRGAFAVAKGPRISGVDGRRCSRRLSIRCHATTQLSRYVVISVTMDVDNVIHGKM